MQRRILGEARHEQLGWERDDAVEMCRQDREEDVGGGYQPAAHHDPGGIQQDGDVGDGVRQDTQRVLQDLLGGWVGPGEERGRVQRGAEQPAGPLAERLAAHDLLEGCHGGRGGAGGSRLHHHVRDLTRGLVGAPDHRPADRDGGCDPGAEADIDARIRASQVPVAEFGERPRVHVVPYRHGVHPEGGGKPATQRQVLPAREVGHEQDAVVPHHARADRGVSQHRPAMVRGSLRQLLDGGDGPLQGLLRALLGLGGQADTLENLACRISQGDVDLRTTEVDADDHCPVHGLRSRSGYRPSAPRACWDGVSWDGVGWTGLVRAPHTSGCRLLTRDAGKRRSGNR